MLTHRHNRSFRITDGTTFIHAECGWLPGARGVFWQQPAPRASIPALARGANADAGAPAQLRVRPTPSAPPSPWQARVSGQSAGVAVPVFPGRSRSGSGADIWGTADAFHYLYQPLPYDGDLLVRVAAVEGSNAWTKAGVMIRESLTPGSRHVSMFVSPGKGVAYQRRLTTGGTSLHTTAALATAPYWLKVTRRDKYIRAFHSVDGVNWGNIGLDVFEGAGQMYIGLAVTTTTTRARLAFSTRGRLAIHPRNLPPAVRLTTPSNGSTFRDPADVMLIAEASDPDDGVRVVQFQAMFDGGWSGLGMDEAAPWSAVWPNARTGTYTVRAVAWDFADAQTISDPVTFTVTDGSLEGQGFARPRCFGVQAVLRTGIRSSSGFQARNLGHRDAFHYFARRDRDFQSVRRRNHRDVQSLTKRVIILRTPSISPTYRCSTLRSGIAFPAALRSWDIVHTDTGMIPPIWLNCACREYGVAYRSPNGVGWYLVATQTLTLPSTVKVGLAVTSHDNTTLATATFSHVAVSPLTPWTSKDIGSVGVAGTTGGFDPMSVEGSGADICIHPRMRSVRVQGVTGDGEVLAQVNSVETPMGGPKRCDDSRGLRRCPAASSWSRPQWHRLPEPRHRCGLTTHAAAGRPGPYWCDWSGRARASPRYSPDGRMATAGSRTIALPDGLLGLAVRSQRPTLCAATFQVRCPPRR